MPDENNSEGKIVLGYVQDGSKNEHLDMGAYIAHLHPSFFRTPLTINRFYFTWYRTPPRRILLALNRLDESIRPRRPTAGRLCGRS